MLRTLYGNKDLTKTVRSEFQGTAILTGDGKAPIRDGYFGCCRI